MTVPFMNDALEKGTQQTNSMVVEMVSDLICPWCFAAGGREIDRYAHNGFAFESGGMF